MRAIIVLILLHILFFHSCGIDEFPVLYSPIKLSPSDIGYFQFDSTEKNGGPGEEDYFRGFELYYKFYNTRVEAQAEEWYTSQADLSSHGFFRLTYFIDENHCDKKNSVILPLIKVATGYRGRGSRFTIDFTLLSKAYLKAEENPSGSGGLTILENNFFLRRGIFDPPDYPDYYKSFESFKIGDDDVTAITGETVYIVLYVYSYGIYGFKAIYSDTVCLGDIEMKIELE